jgi:hypothetical protein
MRATTSVGVVSGGVSRRQAPRGVEVEQRERLGALAEAAIADGERERAVERDDEGAAGAPFLDLPEEQEQQRLDALVLVEAAVAHVPVHLAAAVERERAVQRRECRGAGDRPRQLDGTRIDPQLGRGHRDEQLRAAREVARNGDRPPLELERSPEVVGEMVLELHRNDVSWRRIISLSKS